MIIQRSNERVSEGYRGAAAVDTDDAVDLPVWARALYIGTSTSGELKVTMWDGQTVTFNNIPVGLYPIAVRRVWENGTTVSDITALW